MPTKNNVLNPEVKITEEDAADIFAVVDYLSLRGKIAGEIDEVLIEALKEPEIEQVAPESGIDLETLTEAIIGIFERHFSLRPRGLKEIILLS